MTGDRATVQWMYACSRGMVGLYRRRGWHLGSWLVLDGGRGVWAMSREVSHG